MRVTVMDAASETFPSIVAAARIEPIARYATAHSIT